MKIIWFIIAILSLSACGLTSKKIENCDYNGVQGEEFVFRAASSGSPELYFLSNVPAEGWMTNLDYKKYVNARGKIYEMPPKSEFPSWAVIQDEAYTPVLLDNCEVLYARNYPNAKNNTLINNYIKNAYFLSDEESANKFIGKTVWKKKRGKLDSHTNLFDPVTRRSRQIEPYEDLVVTGINKAVYAQNPYPYGPFYLKVKDESGNEGLIEYSSEVFYLEDPINDNWDNSFISAIKQKSILIGMTDYQVSLAVGLPEEINTTETVSGKSAQWVYEDGTYLYFDDRILTAIQN